MSNPIITITTQQEYDNLPSEFSTFTKIHIKSDPDICINIRSCPKNSTIKVNESSQVFTWGSSQVEAFDSSYVEAYNESHVEAFDLSYVEAYGSSHVEAFDSSYVEAYNESHVGAYNESHVKACDSSIVNIYGNNVEFIDNRAKTNIPENNNRTTYQLHEDKNGKNFWNPPINFNSKEEIIKYIKQSYTPTSKYLLQEIKTINIEIKPNIEVNIP